MDYRNYIEIDPQVRFGKPCIKGTRISVYDVLSWLSSGMTVDELLGDFPQLTKDQILACLGYSADKERKGDCGCMKLLVDENISFRVLKSISSFFPQSIHVTNDSTRVKRDSEIFEYAKENDYTILTFDEDFYDLQLLRG